MAPHAIVRRSIWLGSGTALVEKPPIASLKRNWEGPIAKISILRLLLGLPENPFKSNSDPPLSAFHRKASEVVPHFPAVKKMNASGAVEPQGENASGELAEVFRSNPIPSQVTV